MAQHPGQVESVTAGNPAALNARAWDLHEQDPREALKLADEARRLAEGRGDGLELAKSLRTLGACRNLLYDHPQAEKDLAEALALCEADDRPELRLDILVLLCRVHYSLGNYPTVLERGGQALPLARAQERPFEQAVTLNVTGHGCRVLGLYTEALEYYQASLSLFEMLDHPRRAHPMSGIALVYEHLGNQPRALEYHQAALALGEASGQLHDVAITRSSLGSWHLQQGDPATARGCLEESLAVFREHGDSYNAGAVLLKLGELHAQSGDTEAALACYRQVLSSQNPPVPWHQAVAQLGMSRVHRRLGDLAAALHHAAAALEVANRADTRSVGFEIHRELSELFRDQGDYARALEHFTAYHALKEDVMGQEVQSLRQALMIQFDTERATKDREIYRLRNVELARANEELRALHRKVERLSLEDSLTELHNRRFFNQRLREEVLRAERYGHPLTLMLGDIDNFKHVNDAYSHALGDKVLQAIADAIRKNVRATDIVARYGGEEFVAIFPETHLGEAVDICEILRLKIAKYPWDSLHPGLRVTISIGLAGNDQGDHEAMLELADRRMYEAKRLGKNRVCY